MRERILVVGHSPSAVPYRRRQTNRSIDRLNRWMESVGLRQYSFTNCCSVHVERLGPNSIDVPISKICVDRVVLALGAEVHNTLRRMGIDSFRLPHPSPRNRAFNDPAYESQMLERLLT